jgi:hypothetical protein
LERLRKDVDKVEKKPTSYYGCVLTDACQEAERLLPSS